MFCGLSNLMSVNERTYYPAYECFYLACWQMTFYLWMLKSPGFLPFSIVILFSTVIFFYFPWTFQIIHKLKIMQYSKFRIEFVNRTSVVVLICSILSYVKMLSCIWLMLSCIWLRCFPNNLGEKQVDDRNFNMNRGVSFSYITSYITDVGGDWKCASLKWEEGHSLIFEMIYIKTDFKTLESFKLGNM